MAFIARTAAYGMPNTGDTIHVYNTGTTVHVSGLADLDGNPLSNPFTVPVADFWGFEPPHNDQVDLWWVEGDRFVVAKARLGGDGVEGYQWIAPVTAAAISYDAEDRVQILAETVEGDPRATEYTYNGDGLLVTAVTTYRGLSRTETYSYDGGGLIESVAITIEDIEE